MTSLEYALIAALIAALLFAVVEPIGETVRRFFQSLVDQPFWR